MSSLIRVSVSSGSRRADLGVPGGIPVAEMLPGLARELGQLDVQTAGHRFELVRADGRPLDPRLPLAAQGVTDGHVLTLAMADRAAPKVYDDVVEAVSDLVESEFAPWTAEHSARTALAAALTLFAAGALALFVQRQEGALVAAMAGAVALLLLITGAVLSRLRLQHVAGAGLAVAAAVYAAVSGAALSGQDDLWGEPALFAGAGMVLAGGLGMLAVARHRLVVAATVLLGLALAALGGLTHVSGYDRTHVAAGVFALAVLAGTAIPWFGLSSARLSANAPRTDAEITGPAPEVDGATVRGQVRFGHELMVGLAVGTGAVALLATPHTARGGVSALAMLVVGYAAVLLGARHSRTRATVTIAMVTGIAGIALAALSAAGWHPAWRPTIAVVLAGAAALIVTLALLAPKARVRLGRLGDIVEGAAIVALVPLALIVTGVI
ncbi:MAG: type VII secretion integral membrane protein EccD [Micrococcales bacterium]|nr:type VII secretion integral membrane protein EccD [Micrococcales bacterium]